VRDVRRVTVIGAGVIGAGWTALLAAKGVDATFYTEKKETLDKGMEKVKSYLNVLYENKLVERQPEEYLKRVTPTTDFNEAVKGTDFVLEAVIEDYDV
jgi:3-hydroxyacyl-CoA dehydrogenase